MRKKAAIHTLGCRLNQADAALIAGALIRAGFEMVPWGKPADVIIVNSCTVTGMAAQKTRQAARTARRRNPDAYIVLAGCEANVGTSDWDPLEVVDQVIPNPEKMVLVSHLPKTILPSPAERTCGAAEAWSDATTAGGPAGGKGNLPHTHPAYHGALAPKDASPEDIAPKDGFTLPGRGHYANRTRANLKIQEGCDCFCSYCIVPYARGRSRSRDWDDILRETRELVAAGHREMVLTGVNIAKFASGKRRLPELVQALLLLEPAIRLRLSSTELCPEVEQIIDLMAREPRICRFLHLPIQHGQNDILKAMNRPYTVEAFSRLAESAADRISGLCLGSDVIVGFPGETDAQFEACYQTLDTLPFAFLHVFRYSPRPGTPAADLPGRIHGDVVNERARRLGELGKQKSAAFADMQRGKVLQVLTENRNARGLREGWTDNYLRVELTDPEIPGNVFVDARITATIQGRYVRGERGGDG